MSQLAQLVPSPTVKNTPLAHYSLGTCSWSHWTFSIPLPPPRSEASSGVLKAPQSGSLSLLPFPNSSLTFSHPHPSFLHPKCFHLHPHLPPSPPPFCTLLPLPHAESLSCSTPLQWSRECVFWLKASKLLGSRVMSCTHPSPCGTRTSHGSDGAAGSLQRSPRPLWWWQAP